MILNLVKFRIKQSWQQIDNSAPVQLEDDHIASFNVDHNAYKQSSNLLYSHCQLLKTQNAHRNETHKYQQNHVTCQFLIHPTLRHLHDPENMNHIFVDKTIYFIDFIIPKGQNRFLFQFIVDVNRRKHSAAQMSPFPRNYCQEIEPY